LLHCHEAHDRAEIAGDAVKDSRENTISMNTYDSSNRVISQKDALNHTTTWAYAQFDRRPARP
jgi:YD repeat-containing protein